MDVESLGGGMDSAAIYIIKIFVSGRAALILAECVWKTNEGETLRSRDFSKAFNKRQRIDFPNIVAENK